MRLQQVQEGEGQVTNEELADELIRRLNALIETPDVRDFVQAIQRTEEMEKRVWSVDSG